ncbi:MAG: D-tyrosyl-tRNA(Tyr) deacylase [Bacteroidetes bacterium]|nr:D-tyrosyl-tRNA(Tyr) deacylase [Bacteroidota bacterium]
MRLILQRVKNASVKVDKKIIGAIEHGLLIFVGIEDADNEEDIDWLCRKIVNLRLFDDENGVMNLNVQEVNGNVLLVSQFTLHAAVKKGNRPSYIKASKPGIAIPLYEKMKIELATMMNKPVQTGIFGADMEVQLVNDGPVTLFIDSKNKE